jgi:hypothetical protein
VSIKCFLDCDKKESLGYVKRRSLGCVMIKPMGCAKYFTCGIVLPH